MKDDITYKLTEDDKKDRERALDGYMTVQKSRDKALSILSSSGIALAATMLSTDSFGRTPIATKFVMLGSIGSFAVAILSLAFSYVCSERAFELYINKIDCGQKKRGRNNIYTKMTNVCNYLMFLCFVLGTLFFVSAFILFVAR